MLKQDQTMTMDRRRFLHGSAAVTAGLSLAGMVSFAKTGEAEAASVLILPPNPATVAKPAPAKALYVERKNCTGCGSCMIACSLFHEGVVRPAVSRVWVQRYFGAVDVTNICWHCPDAPCVAACPVQPEKAIEIKEAGHVGFTDETRCLGAACNLCIQSCPSGYLRRHPETAHPMFCDLCGGEPQCVIVCDRQSKESGQTMRRDPVHAGIHYAFRDVSAIEAAEGLMLQLFYPNLTGERIE